MGFFVFLFELYSSEESDSQTVGSHRVHIVHMGGPVSLHLEVISCNARSRAGVEGREGGGCDCVISEVGDRALGARSAAVALLP